MSVAFSPNGAHLASASEDRTLRVWDTKTGKEIRSFKGHADFAEAVGFSADGKVLVSGAVDRTMRVWDLAGGQQISRHPLAAQTRIGKVAIAPDGKQLAFLNLEGNPAAESVVRRVRNRHGQGRPGDCPPVHSASIAWFFPGAAKTLATGNNDGTVRLWDLTTGESSLVFKGQKGDAVVSALAFSDDGRVLAAGGMDRIVRVYEIATGRERLRFEGTPSCYSLAFDPNSTPRLVSGVFLIPQPHDLGCRAPVAPCSQQRSPWKSGTPFGRT